MLRTTVAIIALGALGALAACSTTGGSTPTSWGKAGVSMVDYRLDSAQCIIVASGEGNADGTVDRADAADNSRNSSTGGSGGGAAGGGAVNSGASGMTPGGGPITYSGTATPNDVNQAALAQRAAEMRARRAASEQAHAMTNCLKSRGYREFRLTAEQAAHLATLPEGSAERREYLHSLGSDPAVLGAQGI